MERRSATEEGELMRDNRDLVHGVEYQIHSRQRGRKVVIFQFSRLDDGDPQTRPIFTYVLPARFCPRPDQSDFRYERKNWYSWPRFISLSRILRMWDYSKE